jgi:hypothetical protein
MFNLSVLAWLKIYPSFQVTSNLFVGLAYRGKDIVFTFIVEYSSSLMNFGLYAIDLFLYEDF